MFVEVGDRALPRQIGLCLDVPGCRVVVEAMHRIRIHVHFVVYVVRLERFFIKPATRS